MPALVAGARWRGILGVAMAEVAVALLFLVPWYLVEVRPRVIWPRRPARRFAFPLGVAAAVGVIAAGAHRLAPPGRLDLAIGAAAAAAAMALLLFRLRTVFVAVRQAAARSARRPGRVADVLGPALAVTIEPRPSTRCTRSCPTGCSQRPSGDWAARSRPGPDGAR